MRGLVWFLVVAALAVSLGLAARMNEGYVLIVVPPYRIELSLALFVILFVASFALVYSVLRLLVHTVRLPAYVDQFRRRQREARGHTAMQDAWQSYLEGRFGQAQKRAERAFDLGESPGLAALIAARSAHFLRDPSRRDEWLARASEGAAATRTARLATQAELLLDDRRFEDARGVLTELHQSGPTHVSSLRMMMRAQQGLQNWDEVLRLARQLEKRGAVSAEFARQVTVTATIENLRKKALDADQLRQFWKSIVPDDRREARVAHTAASLFMRLGDCRTAHGILREALDHEWSERLVRQYSECFDADSLARIEHAERWLTIHPRDAALHLTLGRLCVQRELWGKAQIHLETSIAEQPTRAAHVELARLLDRLGRVEQAHNHYRAASDPGLPD